MSTVTPSRMSSSRKSSGERLTQYGTTTRRPPYSSAPHISQTEKSNAYEWNSVHTSSVAEAEPALGRVEQPRDVVVADQHALGLAGRARGVDHIRQIVAACTPDSGPCAASSRSRSRTTQLARVASKSAANAALRHHHPDVRVGEHELARDPCG